MYAGCTESLKQGKADAIVETASGEIIQVEDSSGLGFEGLRIFGKSTQDGVPSPESPKEIKSVGSNGSVNAEVTGKNLCPGVKEGAYGNLDGNYITSNDYTCTELVEVRENVEYCESNSSTKNFEDIHFFDKDRRWISRGSYLDLNKRPANTRFIALNYFKKNIQWVQIEKGSVATAYEPYRTPQSLTLTTPNGLPGIKVDSDGNYTDKNGQQWICDEIDLKNSEFVQRINKIDLKKISIIATNRISSVGGTFFYSTQLPAPLNDVSVRGTMSNIGMCGNAYSEKGDFVWAFTNPANNVSEIRFGFLDDTIDTVEKAMNKLSGLKEAYAMYILKTPIKKALTLAEIAAYKVLHTNYPTTVVSNDESAYMEVPYVADTKNYIASKIETPLQKQITDLQNALISQKISGGGYKSN